MRYSDDDLNWVLDRTRGRCFYCKKQLSFKNYGILEERGAWEIDHFIPLASGGADQPYNWVPACIECNSEKRDLLPWEFDPDRFRQDDSDPDNYI